MKILSLKDMQELLPDYVFGKLDKDSLEAFNANLPNFPEIEKEADEAKKVFARFEQTDFDSLFRNHTRNLSVKVNQRLERKKSIKFSFGRFRYSFPIAVAIFACFALFKNSPNQQISISEPVQPKSQVITKSDAIQLKSSTTIDQPFLVKNQKSTISKRIKPKQTSILLDTQLEIANSEIIIPDDSIAIQLTENLVDEKLSVISEDDIILTENHAYAAVMDRLEQMNENEILYFLKEISNE